MFLVERLVGVSVYLAFLFSVCYLISRLQLRQVGRVLFFYLLIISVLAFLYVPAIEADLYRLLQHMFDYASYSADSFNTALLESSIPATLVYYRIIGSMGIAGLLSAITVFIVFGNLFYVIYNYARRSNLKSRVVSYALFTLMATGIFMQTASGIRNMLAFSIIARCLYDEIYNNKRIAKNIVWYVLACLIHPAAIGAVLLRIVSLIWYKIKKGHAKSLIATIVAIFAVVGLLIYLDTEVYLYNATSMFGAYVEGGVEYNYLWDNVITVLTLVLILINYKIYKHQELESGVINIGQLILLSYVLFMVSIVFFFEHTIFVRFTQLNLIVILPVIMRNTAYLYGKVDIPNVYALRRAIVYVPLAILMVSATRGALSSLKFFTL